jgi:hypothetical protein
MGLHRLELAEWLQLDERYDDELAEKARLLLEARDDVLVTLPEGAGASEELRELVLDDLTAHHGGVGADPSRRDAHPLADASLRVQEDLCVLTDESGTFRLTAACVCFPSRWSPRSKLGATLSGIHGPVPGFESTLGSQAQTFFERLGVDRPVWRSNWTLLDTPLLHLPSPESRRAPAPGGVDDLGDRLWFRVERQTLRRLPRTAAVVFTIRTTVQPLAAALATTPGAADALAATLPTVPEDVAAYKGWRPLLAPLSRWLAAQGAEPARG